MRLKIITVGKLGKGPVAEMVAEYLKRLTCACEIQEIIPKKMPTTLKQKQHEADLIRASIPRDFKVLILDERGQNFSSTELALKIQNFQEAGNSGLCCVIGGADGLDASIQNHADLMVSFGRTTWPHMLMRVLLLEQLYRAQQIRIGHPYHRV
jgi:23S rRNA (pseudouridine1915-N3)-methyltransferase